MSEIEILVYNYSKKRLPFLKEEIEAVVKKIVEILKKEDKQLKKRKVSLAIVFVPFNLIKKMKAFWLKEKSGSVLTFAYWKNQDIFEKLFLKDRQDLGDIFISVDGIKKEAKKAKKPFKDYFLYLLVHSLLHLFGYTHKSKEKFEEMRKKEEWFYEKIKNF